VSTGGRPDANSGGLRVHTKLPGSGLAENPQHLDADLRLHRDGDANGTAVKFLLDSVPIRSRSLGASPPDW